MSFITLEEGTIGITDEGMMLPPVQAVYNADKTVGKKYFNDTLKYVFFVYKKDGVYKDMYEEYRKKLVIERHFDSRKLKDFEDNKRVQSLIVEYLDRQMTKTERFYYQLEKDMEKLLERIHSIPYAKKVKAKVPFEQDGETTMVSAEIEIENYDEKSKAMLLADKLVDYEDKLKAKILKESTDNKKKNLSRLFDRKTV